MVTEYLTSPEAAPAYHSLLPLYFIAFAWVTGFRHDAQMAPGTSELNQCKLFGCPRWELP
jgi:hypothetical protein